MVICFKEIEQLYFLFQVTDYAIARRIIDLHSRLEESVERYYSVVSKYNNLIEE